jgi:hypothetical protein
MYNIIKIGLAILFFLCLLDMPYGFYELIRFIALVGFAILAYQANLHKRQTLMFIYIVLAVLFQPLFKVALGREIWNIIDVIVGIGLLASIVLTPKTSKN